MSAAEDVSLAPALGGRGRSALARVERRDGYLFILPWAIGFVVFFMGPMLASLVLSFTEWQILLAPKWVWLRNYQVMFAGTDTLIRDRLITIALLNTATYAFFSVILYTILALFLSLALNPDIRAMRIYRTMYFRSVGDPNSRCHVDVDHSVSSISRSHQLHIERLRHSQTRLLYRRGGSRSPR